jgi:hypothetical protein
MKDELRLEETGKFTAGFAAITVAALLCHELGGNDQTQPLGQVL